MLPPCPQVRQNLHCVLCFSPVGVDLRSRSRKFPAIVNCTIIDWYNHNIIQVIRMYMAS